MSVAEFLLARYDFEDRACDQALAETGANPDVFKRTRADLEAKRRIVERWRELHPDVLRLLALPYADHPDYDQEWRP